MSHYLLFFQGPNPNVLTLANLPLTSIKEAGSYCNLYYFEVAVMPAPQPFQLLPSPPPSPPPPPRCHHIGNSCVVFLLEKTAVLSLWQY